MLWPEAPGKISPQERLELLLQGLEGDPLLFQQRSMRKRLLAMDELDAVLGGFVSPMSGAAFSSEIESRALALQSRLELANAELYRFLRSGIVRGEKKRILGWLEALAPDGETNGLRSGLGFDIRDDFIASILQLGDPGDVSSRGSREMVAYQPTPVRHVLRLVKTLGLSAEDLFVDLGSGLGHVPLLASMLAGVQSLGIEIEPAYVAKAEECARTLRLEKATFVAADARDADFSKGTIFYLYSPFTGSILDQVLVSLRKQGQERSMKLCSLGPCTCILAQERWLKVRGPLDLNRITLFEPR
jgi:hypothetical protein